MHLTSFYWVRFCFFTIAFVDDRKIYNVVGSFEDDVEDVLPLVGY